MRFPHTFSANRPKNLENIKKQKKKFPEVVEKMIKISDIILQILDARFPEETRNKALEEEIEKQGKLIIYVLNKSDLIKNQNIKISREINPRVFTSTRSKIGIKKLREKIKSLAKNFTEHPMVHVGVIGYPNTGKSSLINILINRKAAGTSHQSGFTKGLQKLRLSTGIHLLDTPGVIPRENYSSERTNKTLDNAILGGRSWEKVKDPELVVNKLMNLYPNKIEKFYKIKAEENSEILLEELGRQKRFLKKGGEIDIDKTARIILKDWQEGKIK